MGYCEPESLTSHSAKILPFIGSISAANWRNTISVAWGCRSLRRWHANFRWCEARFGFSRYSLVVPSGYHVAIFSEYKNHLFPISYYFSRLWSHIEVLLISLGSIMTQYSYIRQFSISYSHHQIIINAPFYTKFDTTSALTKPKYCKWPKARCQNNAYFLIARSNFGFVSVWPSITLFVKYFCTTKDYLFFREWLKISVSD